MLKRLTLFITLLLAFSSLSFAQAVRQATIPNNAALHEIFMNNADTLLEEAVYKASFKHALYSYNIANSTTPGFKPILFPEDQMELDAMVLTDQDHFEKVALEHMTASMARNRNLYSGYLALYKKKFDIYKQVASLGKK